MSRRQQGLAVLGAAVLVASASCDAVLGIEQYGPGAGSDGGTPDATTDSGPSGGDDATAGETGSDASADAKAAEPPSCAAGGPGMNDCGLGGTGSASCCNSFLVTGGKFARSYDGVTYTDSTNPAMVSDFRLDQFEITVGRFRQFVSAVVQGWTPPAGSGKHTHLNGGNGLNATGGGFEAGWDATNWNGQLAKTAADWTSDLLCEGDGGVDQTWTSKAGADEGEPITCETWYEAYAFCIWDGGFLPSEAEWNYAAAGGGADGGQRVYPWSSPSTSTTIDCSHANYDPAVCPAGRANNVGSESPLGDGAYGQADLAGNAWEWNLDWFSAPYVNPCNDCANLSTSAGRVIRGGGSLDLAPHLLASERGDSGVPSSLRIATFGARCARSP